MWAVPPEGAMRAGPGIIMAKVRNYQTPPRFDGFAQQILSLHRCAEVC